MTAVFAFMAPGDPARVKRLPTFKFHPLFTASALSLIFSGCLSPMIRAARDGNSQELKRFLDEGADPNSRAGLDFGGCTGCSALRLALWSGDADTVRTLLDHGADVGSAGSYDGILLAIKTGKVDIVRRLVEGGFPITEKEADYAAKTGRPEIAAYIRRAGGFSAAAAHASPTAAPAVARPARSERPVAAPSRQASDVDRPAYRSRPRPDDFAVVVGIEGYSDLPEALYAEADAAAVKEHLLALGVPRRNIILLQGSKAGRSSLSKYLEAWLPKNVSAESRVYFYFSGHGAPDPESGRAYLLPWDGDPSFLKNTAYPVEKLYSGLKKLKAKEVIVALDACFSGAGGRSVLAKGARPLVTSVDLGTSRGQALTTFTAARADEITSTLEEQGHGIFTYYFLKGLNGAGADASGRVTSKSLYRYLKPHVQDEARRQNREQTPSIDYLEEIVIR